MIHDKPYCMAACKAAMQASDSAHKASVSLKGSPSRGRAPAPQARNGNGTATAKIHTRRDRDRDGRLGCRAVPSRLDVSFPWRPVTKLGQFLEQMYRTPSATQSKHTTLNFADQDCRQRPILSASRQTQLYGPKQLQRVRVPPCFLIGL